MKREDLLSKISDPSKVWDVVVIGEVQPVWELP